MERLERFEQISVRNDMADIVVCGDLEGEIEKSGELSKLEALGSVEIFNELDPLRDVLVRRLSDRMPQEKSARRLLQSTTHSLPKNNN